MGRISRRQAEAWPHRPSHCRPHRRVSHRCRRPPEDRRLVFPNSRSSKNIRLPTWTYRSRRRSSAGLKGLYDQCPEGRRSALRMALELSWMPAEKGCARAAPSWPAAAYCCSTNIRVLVHQRSAYRLGEVMSNLRIEGITILNCRIEAGSRVRAALAPFRTNRGTVICGLKLTKRD